METIVIQELAQRVAISPVTNPVGTIPAAGTGLMKDSAATMLTYIPVSGMAIPYSVANLAAISGVGLIWFDPVNSYLKFRRKSEDNDPNIYVISLSDAIPE